MDDYLHLFSHPVPMDQLPDWWIPEYHANRYLRELSDVELSERVAAIASNLMLLGDDGKYRPKFNVREGEIYAPVRNLDLLRMATEAWEEMQIRGLASLPAIDNDKLQIAKRLADESWCQRPEWIANSRLSLDTYEPPRMLFRFSKSQWNREFFEFGWCYVRPASCDADADLISAVRDDELHFNWYDRQLAQNQLSTDDYFRMCFSAEYDYRLYRDFQADSCVAIFDPDEFSRRLQKAIQMHNDKQPTNRIAQLTECPIVYIDPFNVKPPSESLEVQFCKNFRFAYQSEFRYVLRPSHDCALEPFQLQIGSIEEIAEIVMAPEAAELSGYHEHERHKNP